jgi:hypothetical protein
MALNQTQGQLLLWLVSFRDTMVTMFATEVKKTSSDLSALLGCGAASLDVWCPTFRDNVVVSSAADRTDVS